MNFGLGKTGSEPLWFISVFCIVKENGGHLLLSIMHSSRLKSLCTLWRGMDLIICAFRANMSLPKGKTQKNGGNGHGKKNEQEGAGLPYKD